MDYQATSNGGAQKIDFKGKSAKNEGNKWTMASECQWGAANDRKIEMESTVYQGAVVT